MRPVRINKAGSDEGPTAGVLIIGVDPAGPAQRAGIKLGDVVLSVAEQHVVDTASLRRALTQGVSDGKTDLTIIRAGKAQRIEVQFDKAA